MEILGCKCKAADKCKARLLESALHRKRRGEWGGWGLKNGMFLLESVNK